VSEVGRIRRVAPDGTITTVVGRRIFAPQAPGVPVGDGGPGPPRRLNAAVTAVDGGTHALVVRIRSTDAGTATVTVRSRRGRVVASASASVPSGRPRSGCAGWCPAAIGFI
jgi:hypothetical protein